MKAKQQIEISESPFADFAGFAQQIFNKYPINKYLSIRTSTSSTSTSSPNLESARIINLSLIHI